MQCMACRGGRAYRHLTRVGVHAHKQDPRGTFLSLRTQRAASEHLVPVGRLGCKRFLACARQKLWWMNPEWGSSAAEIPNETQFLLFQLGDPAAEPGGASAQEPAGAGMAGDETYGVLFPLISGAFRCSVEAGKGRDGTGGAGVEGDGRGRHDFLSFRIESGDAAITSGAIDDIAFIATGADPFALVREGMEAVQRQIGFFRLRVDKPVPPILDKFGWCTWDAFYSQVHDTLMHAS